MEWSYVFHPVEETQLIKPFLKSYSLFLKVSALHSSKAALSSNNLKKTHLLNTQDENTQRICIQSNPKWKILYSHVIWGSRDNKT